MHCSTLINKQEKAAATRAPQPCEHHTLGSLAHPTSPAAGGDAGAERLSPVAPAARRIPPGLWVAPRHHPNLGPWLGWSMRCGAGWEFSTPMVSTCKNPVVSHGEISASWARQGKPGRGAARRAPLPQLLPASSAGAPPAHGWLPALSCAPCTLPELPAFLRGVFYPKKALERCWVPGCCAQPASLPPPQLPSILALRQAGF